MNLDILKKNLVDFTMNPDESWTLAADYSGARGLQPVVKHWIHDEWSMESVGYVNNERHPVKHWWWNRSTGSNVGHQALVVYTMDDAVTKIGLSTAARNAGVCYSIEWNLLNDEVRFFISDRPDVASAPRMVTGREVREFDELIIDFILAMIPNWMHHAHQPGHRVMV